jgi:hypothetical protein
VTVTGRLGKSSLDGQGRQRYRPRCEGLRALPRDRCRWLSVPSRQRAIQAASAVADSNHALVAQLLPTYTSITATIASLISLPDYSTTLDAAQIQRVATLMLAGGC